MKPKKLSAYLYEYKLPYLFAICSIVVSVSLDLMSPQLTKRIIDEVIVGGETYKLKYLLAAAFFNMLRNTPSTLRAFRLPPKYDATCSTIFRR